MVVIWIEVFDKHLCTFLPSDAPFKACSVDIGAGFLSLLRFKYSEPCSEMAKENLNGKLRSAIARK
tara:strand:+ start:403 stop:600 length:198 start_codon:yes stop_codon:yes gene_type:complete